MHLENLVLASNTIFQKRNFTRMEIQSKFSLSSNLIRLQPTRKRSGGGNLCECDKTKWKTCLTAEFHLTSWVCTTIRSIKREVQGESSSRTLAMMLSGRDGDDTTRHAFSALSMLLEIVCVVRIMALWLVAWEPKLFRAWLLMVKCRRWCRLESDKSETLGASINFWLLQKRTKAHKKHAKAALVSSSNGH
jgi:hypothetical protein